MKKNVALVIFGVLFMIGCSENPATVANTHTTNVASADSLFTVLVNRVQLLSKTNGYEEASSVPFHDLRDAFDDVISQDEQNLKANLGYMVSAILSLNGNTRIKKMVDSLDAYFSALDGSSIDTVVAPSLSPIFEKQGVIGLGKALSARTADIVLAQTKKPSFPTFVTIDYIQKAIESDLLPVLDNVVNAAVRLENRAETSIQIVVTDNGESDTGEIDKGEIYLADASIRLLSAFANWLCAYKCDLFAPGAADYSWIDSLADIPSSYTPSVFMLAGDTLVHCYRSYPGAAELYLMRLLKYNATRPEFLTLRSANHAKIKQNLTAVPALLKSAIASIRNETGPQQYDLVKVSNVLDIDKDMVNTPQHLIDQGVSPALANKFRSPESLLDFITELLNGPYAFDETLDSVTIKLTVDICAFLDHPVQDLRFLLPKYRWVDEASWIGPGREQSRYVYPPQTGRTIYTYPGDDSVAIAAPLFDSVVAGQYGETVYYLKQSYVCRMSIDSSWSLDPLRLVDDNGTDLAVDSLTKASYFFPYFDDYTFDGVFPGMTRQKWLDMIYQ